MKNSKILKKMLKIGKSKKLFVHQSLNSFFLYFVSPNGADYFHTSGNYSQSTARPQLTHHTYVPAFIPHAASLVSDRGYPPSQMSLAMSSFEDTLAGFSGHAGYGSQVNMRCVAHPIHSSPRW